jgi:hypothetical protein
MKRYLLILSILATAATKPFAANAQLFDKPEDGERPKMTLRERIFVGGGVQLSFGTITAVGASPIVGYRVTPNWAVGVGGTYTYYKDKRFNPAYETSIYGGNVFTRYTIWKNLFAHAELGVTNWEAPIIDIYGHYAGVRRINSWSAPLGGGYAQPLGGNSFFEIMALYDVLYDPATSYSGSPFTFRAGVNIGF